MTSTRNTRPKKKKDMTFVCRKKIKNSIHVQHTQYEQIHLEKISVQTREISQHQFSNMETAFLTNVLYIAEDIANGTVMIVRECRSR